MISVAGTWRRVGVAVLIALIASEYRPCVAEEYVIRNRDGSIRERVVKNPYTGGYDIREKSGRRVGTIERNPYTGKVDARGVDGRRLGPNVSIK
jgi:hypothetical protein